MRIMFLRDILNEEKESLIRKFYELQVKKPTKGDWASTCAKDFNQLGMNLAIEEIRSMSRKQFKNILKEKINELAFKYLIERRGKKGSEMEYSSLRMSDYLLPSTKGLTISDKQELFAIKNRMVEISFNFPKNKNIDTCQCGEEETIEHIYSCKLLSKQEEHQLPYKLIFTGNIGEQITIFRSFQNNMKERENILKKEKQKNKNSHVIPCGDPLYNDLYRNGFK